jgi:hypothetical protein
MAPLNSFFTQGKSGWSLQFDGTERDFQSLHEMLSKTPREVDAMSAGAREAASAYDWGAAVPRFARHYHQVLSLDGLGDPGKRRAE